MEQSYREQGGVLDKVGGRAAAERKFSVVGADGLEKSSMDV